MDMEDADLWKDFENDQNKRLILYASIIYTYSFTGFLLLFK